MKQIFNELDYSFSWKVLNARDYGVPQNRERLFVVGFRNDLDLDNVFIFPEAVELEKNLYFNSTRLLRFDMSEYAQENSDQKLIGAPPGYVGYEEGGQLTNAVKEKPFSIILFDEIEKAAKPNPRILDIFLQILEDGRLTDSKGETVYFSESVIIFTSNLGASEVSSSGSNEEIAQEFIKIVKNYFDNEIKRPEILGRIGYSNIVPFNFIKDKEFSIKIAKRTKPQCETDE